MAPRNLRMTVMAYSARSGNSESSDASTRRENGKVLTHVQLEPRNRWWYLAWPNSIIHSLITCTNIIIV